MKTRTHRLIATVAAALAFAVLPAAANAAIRDAPTVPQTSPDRYAVVYVEAGSTGDGPADEAECIHHADEINAALDRAAEHFVDGNEIAAQRSEDVAAAQEDLALTRGCFIVYRASGDPAAGVRTVTSAHQGSAPSRVQKPGDYVDGSGKTHCAATADLANALTALGDSLLAEGDGEGAAAAWNQADVVAGTANTRNGCDIHQQHD